MVIQFASILKRHQNSIRKNNKGLNTWTHGLNLLVTRIAAVKCQHSQEIRLYNLMVSDPRTNWVSTSVNYSLISQYNIHTRVWHINCIVCHSNIHKYKYKLKVFTNYYELLMSTLLNSTHNFSSFFNVTL